MPEKNKSIFILWTTIFFVLIIFTAIIIMKLKKENQFPIKLTTIGINKTPIQSHENDIKEQKKIYTTIENTSNELPLSPPVITQEIKENDDRKKKYGINKAIDIVAKPNELFQVGEFNVPINEILDAIHLKKEELVEKDINGNFISDSTEEYGIYIVQPQSNIWNIHFELLKEYFKNKGIELPSFADEPLKGGYSSGIGKVLKFSENTVFIYNVKEHKLEEDISQLEPFTKIIIYNMHTIFSFLNQLSYEDLNKLQFDGKTIWINVN
ncbi:MAG: hypothetical protein HQK76_15750 [Desulfobacterales bacterium]|nr:hypothetical protein [Desulfobacterales bacterium]